MSEQREDTQRDARLGWTCYTFLHAEAIKSIKIFNWELMQTKYKAVTQIHDVHSGHHLPGYPKQGHMHCERIKYEKSMHPIETSYSSSIDYLKKHLFYPKLSLLCHLYPGSRLSPKDTQENQPITTPCFGLQNLDYFQAETV